MSSIDYETLASKKTHLTLPNPDDVTSVASVLLTACNMPLPAPSGPTGSSQHVSVTGDHCDPPSLTEKKAKPKQEHPNNFMIPNRTLTHGPPRIVSSLLPSTFEYESPKLYLQTVKNSKQMFKGPMVLESVVHECLALSSSRLDFCFT